MPLGCRTGSYRPEDGEREGAIKKRVEAAPFDRVRRGRRQSAKCRGWVTGCRKAAVRWFAVGYAGVSIPALGMPQQLRAKAAGGPWPDIQVAIGIASEQPFIHRNL